MCDHNVKIGDNYGISCHECGVRLEGYGYWAHENKCLHHFVPDGNGDEVCMYCEMWRSTAQHDADVQDADLHKFGWNDDWRPMTSSEIAAELANMTDWLIEAEADAADWRDEQATRQSEHPTG